METDPNLPIRLAAPPAPTFFAAASPAFAPDDTAAARIMPGGIGYLAPRGLDAGAITRAFADLEETRALILDLRDHDGGAADAMLLGHLSRRPIPMARIRRSADGGLLTLWTGRATTPDAGPLYPDNPLFVLIGRRSTLPAQALAYDLRACGRAVVINETEDLKGETLLTAWRRALSLRGRIM
jgi:C-terminal processing protease CtpA/Prc